MYVSMLYIRTICSWFSGSAKLGFGFPLLFGRTPRSSICTRGEFENTVVLFGDFDPKSMSQKLWEYTLAGTGEARSN